MSSSRPGPLLSPWTHSVVGTGLYEPGCVSGSNENHGEEGADRMN